MNSPDDSLQTALIRWYTTHRRDLPWRVPRDAPPSARPNPYHVLVSEAMLQQTQVATVIPYFLRFIKRFRTIHHLARADEQQVLRLWQGLGYYSRARNLRLAAKHVAGEFEGELPNDVSSLRRLPGVGRYTAGAIASLAFDRRAAIVDGNVARVLCRLERIESCPREKMTKDLLWEHAEALLPQERTGDFNSALMELGATICTPRAPKCHICPIRAHCKGFAAGLHKQIPRRRKSRPTPLIRRRTFCIRRINGNLEQWLIEQRPSSGRWAGMWQFVTRPLAQRSTPFRTTRPIKVAVVQHQLTHRRYRFDVYRCDAGNGQIDQTDSTRWVTLRQLKRYPLPRPHVKVAALLNGEAD